MNCVHCRSSCIEFWTCRQSFSFAACCGSRSNTKICISAAKVCFFHPPPLQVLAPLLRNMTTSNPALFASGHLDAGISAKHMLHSKQPQCSTEQDNKTQPKAKAFPPKSKCCSQPKVPSVQVQLAFCSWRSSKSPGYSPLNTMKRSDSLQIQPECLGTVGPHNRRGRASY